MTESGIKADFKHICVEDEFIKQAGVQSQLRKYHLDTQSVINIVGNKG